MHCVHPLKLVRWKQFFLEIRRLARIQPFKIFFFRLRKSDIEEEVMTAKNICEIIYSLVSISQNQNMHSTMLPPLLGEKMQGE